MDMTENSILYDLIKEQTKALEMIKEDIHEIRMDMEKTRSLLPVSVLDPQSIQKERLKASVTGGGLGAAAVTVLTGLWEYFKLKSGS